MNFFARFKSPSSDILLLAIVVAAIFCFSLGDRLYSAPSESRYIEIGREMAESGDFITPRLNYVKYFEKPPLFYWVQAGFTSLLDVGTFVSRLPTALFSVALSLVTYALGSILYGRLAGIFSALILSTTIYVFALSRVVLVDVPVSLFMDATLTAFLYCALNAHREIKSWVIYAMYASAAFAVLSKGLIGIVLPAGITFFWLAATNQWRLVLRLHLLGGIALFLLIVLPWHIMVALRNPEFFHFYFIHEHFERYFTKVHGRFQPKWFFIPILIGGFSLWIAFLLQAVKAGLSGFWSQRYEDASKLFLVLWVSIIFVFFSLSDSKLPAYILPIFPPLAVLLGYYFAELCEGKKVIGYRTGVALSLLLLVAVAATSSVVPMFVPKDSKLTAALTQAADDIKVLSGFGAGAAIFLIIVIVQLGRIYLFAALVLIAIILLQLGDQVAEHYGSKSILEFTQAIKALGKPNDEVVAYDMYPQDLPVYLKRKITIVNWRGELEFGTMHEDTSSWMIDEKEFWRRWLKNDHRMFMIIRMEAMDRLTKTIGMKEDEKKYAILKEFMDSHHMYGVIYDEASTIVFTNQDFKKEQAENEKRSKQEAASPKSAPAAPKKDKAP